MTLEQTKCSGGFCEDHKLQVNKVEILEKKFEVVEQNTITVNKLASRLSLLLTIMSFTITIVMGGAIYTFTGLSNFKDIYSADRLKLQETMTTNKIENRNLLQNEIRRVETAIDKKFDVLQNSVSQMEILVQRTNATVNSKK